MPEGDTIWRAARTLHRALAGQSLTGVRSAIGAVESAGLAGRTVEAVESRGKNLLVRFDDGRVLYTHMRMTGSWHIYRPGEAWQRPPRQARVVLETTKFVAVCFNAPVVEVLSAGALRRHPTLSRLGPDLLAEGFDPGEARRRLRESGADAIGKALLRQSALAGVGNLYKSETLFLCGVNPFVAVRELSDDELDRVVAKARALMSANLSRKGRSGRTLAGSDRPWVYRRRGRPCRRCGTLIRMRRQGEDARSTYWCPNCQPTR
jgi:endonuclease VIII